MQNRTTIGTGRIWGAIFSVLLKHSFDGVLGAPLRTTVLKRGVPGESIFPWKDHPPAGRGPGSSENMAPPRTIWRERWLKNSAKSGSIASWTYRDSIFDLARLSYEKSKIPKKNAIHEGGMSRLFLPLNRASSLLKGPFKGFRER